jgi:hypothetical protein
MFRKDEAVRNAEDLIGGVAQTVELVRSSDKKLLW